MRISDEDHTWIRGALSLVPDCLIGIGVAYYTASGIVGGVATVVALQVVYAVLWGKNRLWNWALYRLTGDREQLRTAMLATLRDNRFPRPDPYFRGVTAYFQSVIDDQTLACHLRIKAAAELAAIQRLPKLGGQLRLLAAWDDALDQYRRTFPATQEARPAAVELGPLSLFNRPAAPLPAPQRRVAATDGRL